MVSVRLIPQHRSTLLSYDFWPHRKSKRTLPIVILLGVYSHLKRTLLSSECLLRVGPVILMNNVPTHMVCPRPMHGSLSGPQGPQY